MVVERSDKRRHPASLRRQSEPDLHADANPPPTSRSLRRPPSLSRLSEWEQTQLRPHSAVPSLLDGLLSPRPVASSTQNGLPRAASSATLSTTSASSGDLTVLPDYLAAHPAAEALRGQAAAARNEQDSIRYFVPRSTGSELSGLSFGGLGGLAADRLVLGDSGVASAVANRNGISGGVDLQPGDASTQLTGFQLADASAIGAAHAFAMGNDAMLSASASTLGGSGFAGSCVGLSLSTGALTASLGLVGLVSADASLQVLAPYLGDDPLRAGRFLVQWQQHVAPTFGVEVAGNLHTFGVGGRFLLARHKQATYRLYLTPATIRQILRQQDRRFGALRGGLQALGLKKAPLRRLAASDVLNAPGRGGFLVDESFTLSVTEVGSAGISPGAYGLRAGIFGTLSRERELTVTRSSSHEVELTLAPKQTISASGNFEAAVLAEAYVQGSRSRAQTRSVLFDLDETAARDALEKFLGGRMPLEAVRFEAGLDDKRSATQLDAVHLPRGVSLQFLEHAGRAERRAGGGLAAPKLPFTSSRVGGLSRHRTTATETSTVYAAHQAVHLQTYLGELETQMLLRGNSKSTAQAAVYRSSSSDEESPTARFDGLMAEVSFRNDRVVGNTLNRQVAPKLRRLDDGATAAFYRPGQGAGYTLTVQRYFSPDEFADFVHLDRQTVAAAARSVNIPAAPLHDVLQARDANALGAYLSADDGARLSAVHKLSGNRPQDLHVSTEVELLDKAVRRTQAMLLAYPLEECRPGSSLWKTARRQAKRNEARLTAALHAVNDDQPSRAHAPDALVQRLQTAGELRLLVRSFARQLDEARAAVTATGRPKPMTLYGRAKQLLAADAVGKEKQ